MADLQGLAKLKVAELKELAAEHNVEVAEGDNKAALAEKISAAITPEDLTAFLDTKKDSDEPAPTKDQGADIAAAIRDGLKDAKGEKFVLEADAGVEPRFSLVKNKDGEILLRENETGVLSKIQLESIEEKEASIQNQEVEEL